LTVAINTLFQKGYVRRYPDPLDRRKVLISLEQKAKDVLEVHKAFHKRMIDSIYVDLKLDEDEVLIKTLRNVSEYFKNYPID